LLFFSMHHRGVRGFGPDSADRPVVTHSARPSSPDGARREEGPGGAVERRWTIAKAAVCANERSVGSPARAAGLGRGGKPAGSQLAKDLVGVRTLKAGSTHSDLRQPVLAPTSITGRRFQADGHPAMMESKGNDGPAPRHQS